MIQLLESEDLETFQNSEIIAALSKLLEHSLMYSDEEKLVSLIDSIETEIASRAESLPFDDLQILFIALARHAD